MIKKQLVKSIIFDLDMVWLHFPKIKLAFSSILLVSPEPSSQLEKMKPFHLRESQTYCT